MLVHVSHARVPLETFNISFESTQNKQQCGTKITSTAVKGEKLWWLEMY